MTEQELKKRAKANISFYRHLITYVIVNFGLFVLDYLDNGYLNWAYFSLFGWGIGLLSHLIQIKSFHLFSVEKEMERIRRKNG